MAANMLFENPIIERLFEFRTPFIEGDDLFKFRIPRSTVKSKRIWVVMGPDVKVWLLCLMVVISRCHGYQEQRFAMEPQDQSAILGSRVTFPCRVENKAGTLQWTKDDFGLGTHRNLSGYERYRMIGSDEEGDYSLDIRDVTLDDDGQYQCQVSSGLNGEPAIRSRYAQLTVLVAPDPPRIIQGAFIDATEGQDVMIECVSTGGKPAAEITWVDGSQVVIKKNVENRIELSDNGQTFTTRSVLRLTPSKEHHNRTITCQAQNTADRAFRVATIQIEVKYVPKIKLFVKSELINERIPEGTEARIGCEVDANPEAQSYRWYLNDNPVVGDYTDEMIIFNVTRKHNNGKVRCEVSNAAGQSAETMVLEVTFPPTFRSRPQNIEADDGSTVKLRCDVDGHPEPEIRWLYHEPGRIGVKGKTSTLKVQVSNETAGRYICKATIEGYPEVESEATVFVKGGPKILSNRTQLGSEGDSVRVECAAFSVPKPDDISWYYEGREINAILDPDYATLEESLPEGIIKSTLVIRASKSHHFGKYNCSITNEYGNDNIAIVLKPIQTLPLLIIIIGVTSTVIIITGLVILIVMCHKRRRNYSDSNKMNEKPDVTVTTSDIYKDSDRNSNISDLKPQWPSDGNYDLDYTSSEASQTKGGLPLAGPVPLRLRHDDALRQLRYSNDYSDPAFSDPYHFKNSGFVYDYQPGYPHPPNLRVQSPNPADLTAANRSLQGSLTRSIDTSSTVPLTGNGSQNNSLKRTTKSVDETDAINSLGLPVGGDTPPTPIYAQPNIKSLGNGLDARYAANYGTPYLRNSSMGFGGQLHSSKPTSTPAPPPYSARSSVVISSGTKAPPAHATHV